MKSPGGMILVLSVVMMFAMIGPTPAAPDKKDGRWKYPAAKTGDVVEDFHGTPVADPYSWMEDADAPDTMAWVEAENRLTHRTLDAIPAREAIEKRMRQLWNYPKYGVPERHGARYFFTRNDGMQNQSVLYVVNSLDGEPRVLIDPNTLSADGTVAMTGEFFSDDGSLIAYALSSGGSDRQEIRIRRVESGEDFPETIRWVKFVNAAWKHDNSGFFYNRYPEPGTVPEEDENNFSRIYWHRLGDPQEKDVLVYEMPDNKEIGFVPIVTEDGEYLYLVVFHGTDDRQGFYFRKVGDEGEFARLLEFGEAKYDAIGNVGRKFYFQTDLDAPRGRVIEIDLDRSDRGNWKTIIPEGKDVISGSKLVNDKLVIQYMHNAHELLKIYDLGGEFVADVPLPTMGSVRQLSGRQAGTEMFFEFTSFVYPPTIYRYDFDTGRAGIFRASEIDFDPSRYETRQEFFTSKDGTRVPMFITYRKGMKKNGDNPTLVYGYGGFNIDMSPYFSVTRLVWLENGGILAVVNLRGGNEFGEEWHRAGMLGNKQNVFDDFIAASEYLINRNYTRRERLGINGGSNGGLLVTACMLQRPDLFGAVVAQVPVTDMLHYHHWTVGRYWVPEYGNAEDNPEQFRFLYRYSPLHNIKAGVAYPPTLVTTADTDDRVVPVHGKKFVAALQAADAGTNPILIRVETRAGHGAGKPTGKIIEEYSDIYAFLFWILGMKPPA